jgi:acyl-CoA thioester hydrolase
MTTTDAATAAHDRAAFTLVHPMRVRWAEVDMQRVVFNGNYLTYFDTAVAEYWRAITAQTGRDYTEDYLRLYAVKATLDFHASAHYDEMIDVGCRLARLGRSSMTLAFRIWRGDERLVSGEIVYVHVGAAEKKSAPLPDYLRGAMLAFEQTPPAIA